MGIETGTNPNEAEQVEDPSLKLFKGIEAISDPRNKPAAAEQGKEEAYVVGQKIEAIVNIGGPILKRPCEILGPATGPAGLEGTYFKVKVDMGEGQPTIESVIRKEDIRK